jgi:hypothetical protein
MFSFEDLIRANTQEILLWLCWDLGNLNSLHAKAAERGIQLLTMQDIKDTNTIQALQNDEVQTKKQVAGLLCEYFLYLFDTISNSFSLKPASGSKKGNQIDLGQFLPYSELSGSKKTRVARHALRALSGLLSLVGPQLYRFVPKVLSTLKHAYTITDSETRLDVCDVWLTCVKTLENQYLGKYLSQIVVSLLPYVENSGQGDCKNVHSQVLEKICDILKFLLVDRQKELGPFFSTIPFLPSGVKVLESLIRVVETHIGEKPFQKRIENFIRLMSHESSDVLAEVLKNLALTLQANRGLLASQSLEGSFGQLIGKLVRSLLTSCSESSNKVKLACCHSIGEFGAVDPGLLATILVREDDSAQDDSAQSKIQCYYGQNEDRFAAQVIKNVLVYDLRATNNNPGVQNKTLFAIQEVLRLCGRRLLTWFTFPSISLCIALLL